MWEAIVIYGEHNQLEKIVTFADLSWIEKK
jgi:hypothetical protein